MRVNRATVIGAFVLGGIGVAVAAILFFGTFHLFTHTARAVVFFEGSIGGLSPGAPVAFRGVRIGSVASTALIVNRSDLKTQIPVYLEIDPERVTLTGLPAGPQSAPSLQRLVEAGLRAQLSMQSLVTGQMQVELDLRPETPARLIGAGAADVPELPAIPSDFEELRQQLVRTPIAETVAQAGRTLVAVEKLANRINAELDPLAASAQRTLDSATHTLVIAEASIQHLQEDATATLEELRALANDGHRQLDNRSRELSRVLVSADQALHSANTFMDSADNLVARRSPARTNLEAALRDLADTARALRGFSQTVERNPNALLLGRLGQ